jgi:hypothetical protein
VIKKYTSNGEFTEDLLKIQRIKQLFQLFIRRWTGRILNSFQAIGLLNFSLTLRRISSSSHPCFVQFFLLVPGKAQYIGKCFI